jgi:hypothetical protein
MPEKEQILYNHLKLGRQNKEFISEVKPYWGDIVKHPIVLTKKERQSHSHVTA